jgi:hypothetical protein
VHLDGPSRMGALAGAVVCLCGCPNPNAYTVPRTLEPGDLQIVLAAEAYGFGTRIAGPASAASSNPTSTVWGATPLLPTIGIRYGLAEGVDVGARFENFQSVAGDVKLRLLRGLLDMAVDPGLDAIYVDTGITNPNSTTVTRSAGVFYLQAPLMLGLNFSDSLTLVASPGLAYAIATGPLAGASHAEQAGASTALLARLGLGVDVRTSDRFAIHPELTCMRGFNSAQSLLCVVGLALNIGAQANYDDLRPAQPAEP